MQWLRISLVLAAIAVVYFYRLDKPPLWGDEADTGIFARNALHTGLPVAYDNRNVTMYNFGIQLNARDLWRTIPWIQYYVGTTSLAIFGDTTAGLRILFVLIGLAAFFPIWAVLRSRVLFPEIVTALILLAPQIVMFQRNARYYSTVILLYAILVWLLTVKLKSTKLSFSIALIVLVLFFHTHPLAAGACTVSLVLYCALLDRRSLISFGTASAIGFLSWLVWRLLLGPSLSEKRYAITTITENFGGWLNDFLTGLGAAIFDFDAVDCFPIAVALLLTGILAWRDRNTFISFFKQPLPAFVLINLLAQALATAAIVGSEWDVKHSMLRYEPHLLVFALAACFVLLSSVVRNRLAFVGCCLICLSTNVLNISYWVRPYVRDIPISWVFPVYKEIFQSPDNVWSTIVSKLRSEARNAPDQDSVVIASPPWTQEILLFYVGDLYIVPPIFSQPCARCEEAIVRLMGHQALIRMAAKPQWLVDTLGPMQNPPADFAVVATIPAYTTRPDDGARPELTQHSFAQEKPIRNITIYRLKPNAAAE